MFVFGYGSLMWDHWEDEFGCVSRHQATLPGFVRSFSKASTVRWGTPAFPGPTLTINELGGAQCVGAAFEFPQERENEVVAYLRKREGQGFPLVPVKIVLDSGLGVSALAPIYGGKQVIAAASVEETAQMVMRASGTGGACVDYVLQAYRDLQAIGIDDPAVTSLRNAIDQLQEV